MFGSKDNPTPAKGGCAGHAVDGIQPITNFVLNPSVENTLLNYGWPSANLGAGYSASAVTDFAYSGTRSAKIVAPAKVTDSFLLNTVTVPSAGTSFAGACGTNGRDAMWMNGLA